MKRKYKIVKKKSKIICGILSGILFSCVSVITVCATEEIDGTMGDEVQYEGGYIEFPEEEETPSVGDSVFFAETLRAYDGRENVPEVRNQNPYGVCWAFASLGMGDIELQKDLSELHLAYYIYHSVMDPLGGTEGDCNALQSGYDYMRIGGNMDLAANSLMSWKGAVDETVLPYSMAAEVQQNGMDDSNAYADNSAHLKNMYRINLKEDSQMVKNAILQYGAVATSYYSDKRFYDSINNSYYCNTNYTSNHAVMIVGWNDDFSKENFITHPLEDGAWLIRNSWGVDGDGYSGYFWISYEDASLIGTAYAFDYTAAGAEDYYDNNYQYDGVITSGYFKDYGTGCIKGANIFTAAASDYESLKAVSFSTKAASSECLISIYKNLQDERNPESGELVAEQEEYTVFSGIHTIDLESEVPLRRGEKYSVVVSLSGDNEQSIEAETSSYTSIPFNMSATIHPGESFINVYGQWEDMSTKEKVGNIRIKAYTNNDSAPIQNIEDQMVEVKNTESFFDGLEKEPSVNVTGINGEVLEKGIDYTVTYANNVKCGTAEIIVDGIGNYTGKIIKTFQIKMKPGWVQVDNKRYYGSSDGTMKTGWLQQGKSWYYLQPSDGSMAVGLENIGSTKYYFNGSGVMQTGWQKSNGAWYYFTSGGAAKTGWLETGGVWYYLQPNDCKMAVGLKDIGSTKYYFNGSGVMQTGWQKSNGAWYYFTSGGAAKTGWLKTGGVWYYLQPNDCKMAVGLKDIGSTKYYFNGSGVMQTGWQKSNGAWYYFTSGGAAKTGWLKTGGVWYYLQPNDCKMAVGLKEIGSTKYYFNGSGVMQTGWQRINGAWYYFTSTGSVKIGWLKTGGVWYYLQPGDCRMVIGLQAIGNSKYYFNGSGVMQTGWQKIDENWYYFNAGGAMVKNQNIGGYHLNEDGIWVQ